MIPFNLNPKFVQFQKMTEDLQTTLQAPEGATQEKILTIAQAWMDFLQSNRSSILQSLHRAEEQAAPLLDKVEQVKANLAAVPQLQEAFDILFGQYPFPLDLLPPDLLRKVMSFLTFKELTQVGEVARNLRTQVLDIRTWRSNRMFQKLLQSGKKEGGLARDEFANILRGYQQQALAPALAAEFATKANHDAWRHYLEEIDKDGRDMLHHLLKDQDFSDLRFLYLPGYNWLDKDGLNFEFFLSKCRNLNVLHVVGGQKFVTDSVLMGLAERYPELNHFNCEVSSVVTGSYLNSWPVTKIETLELGGSPKFQAHYLSANIAKFPELKKLLLFNLRLKDEDLSHLAKLPKLEMLDLSANPHLTDATLAILAQLPSLKKVNLQGVKDITPGGIRTLRQTRPNLSVVYD